MSKTASTPCPPLISFTAADKDPVSSGGAQSSRSYTVKDGDRLDGIAASELGDSSRWTEIAMENDIDDPTALTVGQNLKIPS